MLNTTTTPGGKSVKKIAIIGGSFNPVTNGHIKMAEAVLASLPDLHRVWLMPAYLHPFHKHREYATERIIMLRMAETDRIRYFDYEIDHKLTGETYGTFTRLLNDPDYKHLYDFHMVIGSDCLLDFDYKWKHAERLADLVKFIVIPRQGYDIGNYDGLLSNPPHIILDTVKTPDISATRIRERIRKNQSIQGMVPDGAAAFIRKKNIFSSDSGYSARCVTKKPPDNAARHTAVINKLW